MTERPPSGCGVLFDLDGVLTDTAELHYESWKTLADELGIVFDRDANEPLRGLSRIESLAIFLGERAGACSEAEKRELARRKNELYLHRVASMTPDDLFDGVAGLLVDLQTYGIRLAVASASRNARAVLDRLRISDRFDVVVDGNDVLRSKPDPQIFLVAAERLNLPPERCVVVEDAESGVSAARAAGMRVVGVGPAERVGGATRVVAATGELTAQDLIDLALGSGRA